MHVKPLLPLPAVLLSLVLLPLCQAQGPAQTSSPRTTPSGTASLASATAPSPSYTVSTADITTTLLVPLSSRSRPLSITSIVPTTITSRDTIYLTSTTSATPTSTSSTSTTSPSPTVTPVPHLATKVNGALAALGVFLILTGLPSAFMGHKNRWSSFFLLGFYTLATVVAVIILKLGVENREQQEVSLPSSKLQGLYLFACLVAGFCGGAIAIFFWQATKYLIGAMGGFIFAMWIQAMRHSGLVRPLGFRWLMYIGCSVIGFVLCTIPKLHYQVLLGATAMTGATAFMLGVDCFTTAGLKEFYVWNLGFEALFPAFSKIGFGISQTIAIELGLIAAIALAGAAVQMRLLLVLKLRLQQIKDEHQRKDAELEAKAQERFRDVEAAREEWEKKYGHGSKGGSVSTSLPLLNHDGTTAVDGGAGSDTPGTPTRPVSSLLSFPVLGRRDSTNLVGNINESPAESVGRPSQSPGPLPTLELGSAVKDQLPSTMISKDALAVDEDPEIKERLALLGEIRNIRQSLDALSTTSYSTRVARTSLGNTMEEVTRATTATNSAAALKAKLRDPANRERVRSMFNPTSRPLSTTLSPVSPSNLATGIEITRPTSTPLSGPGITGNNYEWETYVAERKLFTPPSGISPPIPTSEAPPSLLAGPSSPTRPSMGTRHQPSEAVLAAIKERQKKESVLQGERSVSPSPLRQSYDLGDGGETADGATDAGTGARDRSSWISFKNWDPRRYRHERSRTSSSGGMLQFPPTTATPTSQGPINVLPPISRLTTRSHPTPPSQPQERTLTYEEYTERHKSRMHALQEPLSQAAQKEAQVEDARSRWERSKDIEGKVMKQREAEKRRLAEEKARAEKRKSAGPRLVNGDTDLEAQNSDREKEKEKRQRHRRTRTLSHGVPATLSMDLLHSPAGPSRLSSSVKVEEWQKYQAANGPPVSRALSPPPRVLAPPTEVSETGTRTDSRGRQGGGGAAAAAAAAIGLERGLSQSGERAGVPRRRDSTLRYD